MGLGKLNRRLGVMVARLGAIASTASTASVGIEELARGGAKIVTLRDNLAGVAKDLSQNDEELAKLRAKLEELQLKRRAREHDGASDEELAQLDVEVRALMKQIAELEAAADTGEGETSATGGTTAAPGKKRGGGIFGRLRSEAAETAEAIDAVAKKASSFREELAARKAAGYSEAARALLGNEATASLIESYILQLSINPSHPDLKKSKQAIREWSNVDEGFFAWVERFFKDAHEAKRRLRGRRGKGGLGTDQLNEIVDEIAGR